MIRRLDRKTVAMLISWAEAMKQEFINRLRFQDAANMRDVTLLARRGASKAKAKS